MKSYVIVLLFIFSITFAYADSGACSGHGGVSCSAGADYDGSVICMDGWKGSSVKYSSTEMCKTSLSLSDLCPLPFIAGATNMSSCDGYQKICDSYNQGVRNALLQSGAGGRGSVAQYASESADSATSGGCPQAVSCREQVELYNRQMESHNQCVADAKKYQQEEFVRKNLALERTEKEYQCLTRVGGNTEFRADGCYCIDGYSFFNNKCIPENEARNLSCKEQFGEHSFMTPSDVKTCSCETGYEFDANKQCVKSSVSQTTVVEEKKQTVVEKKEKKSPLKSNTAVAIKASLGTTTETEIVRATSTVTMEVKRPWYSVFKKLKFW